MKTGIELIAEERQRQIDQEGYTPDHDDEAYIELSGERSGHQYGIAQDPASLVPRMKHLIALDDPALGGPYEGVAA